MTVYEQHFYERDQRKFVLMQQQTALLADIAESLRILAKREPSKKIQSIKDDLSKF